MCGSCVVERIYEEARRRAGGCFSVLGTQYTLLSLPSAGVPSREGFMPLRTAPCLLVCLLATSPVMTEEPITVVRICAPLVRPPVVARSPDPPTPVVAGSPDPATRPDRRSPGL